MDSAKKWSRGVIQNAEVPLALIVAIILFQGTVRNWINQCLFEAFQQVSVSERLADKIPATKVNFDANECVFLKDN